MLATSCPKSLWLCVFALASCSESAETIAIPTEGAQSREIDFFERGRNFPTGLMDEFAALVDWDRDGDLDAIGLSAIQFGNFTFEDPTLSLYRNDGRGRFDRARTHELESVRLVAGEPIDIDGDQDLEIFLFRVFTENQTYNQSFEVHSIEADGDLVLQWALTDLDCGLDCALPAPFGEPLVGDLDADGDLDFYLAPHSGGLLTTFQDLYAFRNQGDGTFVMEPDPVVEGLTDATALALFDLDNDGILDLLTAGQNLALYRGEGGDSYARPISFPLGAEGSAEKIFLTELNGDGRLDVAVNKHGQYPELFVRQGAFDLLPIATNFPNGGTGTRAPLFTDLRGSGVDDLFIGDGLWVNDGLGGFTDESDRLPGDSTSVSFPLSYAPRFASFAGDLDGDQDMDLWGSATGRVLLQDAAGNFGAELPNTFGEVLGGGSASLADFNGDGIADLLVQGLQGGMSYDVFLRDALGDLQQPGERLSNDDFEWNPFFIDVDGDEDIDIVFGSSGHTYLNDGAGSFTASGANAEPLSRTYDVGVLLEDFDGDGDRDLFHGTYEIVFPNGSPAPDALYLREDDGSWTPAPLPEVETFSWEADCADLDGDGNRDAMVLSGQIYLSAGDGTFTLGQDVFGGVASRTRVLNLGDIDLDGDVDVVLGGTVFENIGGGVFPTSRASGIDDFSRFDGFEDLDMDGDLDAASTFAFRVNTIHWGGPRVDIWANDGSGFFQQERVAVLREYLSNRADVDGDGDLDLFTVDSILLNRSRSLEIEPHPRVGESIQVELYGEPFESFRLVVAQELGSRGEGTGALRIDLGTSVEEVSGSLDASGRATLSITVPSALDVEGTTLYWQARTSSAGLWTAVERSVLRTF